MTEYGPVWQIQQNIASKEAVLRCAHDDLKKANERIARTTAELAEYEIALTILQERLKS